MKHQHYIPLFLPFLLLNGISTLVATKNPAGVYAPITQKCALHEISKNRDLSPQAFHELESTALARIKKGGEILHKIITEKQDPAPWFNQTDTAEENYAAIIWFLYHLAVPKNKKDWPKTYDLSLLDGNTWKWEEIFIRHNHRFLLQPLGTHSSAHLRVYFPRAPHYQMTFKPGVLPNQHRYLLIIRTFQDKPSLILRTGSHDRTDRVKNFFHGFASTARRTLPQFTAIIDESNDAEHNNKAHLPVAIAQEYANTCEQEQGKIDTLKNPTIKSLYSQLRSSSFGKPSSVLHRKITSSYDYLSHRYGNEIIMNPQEVQYAAIYSSSSLKNNEGLQAFYKLFYEIHHALNALRQEKAVPALAFTHLDDKPADAWIEVNVILIKKLMQKFVKKYEKIYLKNSPAKNTCNPKPATCIRRAYQKMQSMTESKYTTDQTFKEFHIFDFSSDTLEEQDGDTQINNQMYPAL